MDNPEKKATLDTRHILKINKTKTKIKKKNNMEPQKTMVNSGVVISLFLKLTVHSTYIQRSYKEMNKTDRQV